MDGDLHKEFRKYMPFADWNRIETGAINQGVPDVNACFAGIEVWIENKKTTTWKVHNIGTEQVGWIERRSRKGGRCFVAVRQLGVEGRGQSARARDSLWLLSHKAARLLIDGASLMSLPPDVVLSLSAGGPAFWRWAEIEATLFPNSLRRSLP